MKTKKKYLFFWEQTLTPEAETAIRDSCTKLLGPEGKDWAMVTGAKTPNILTLDLTK